MSPLLRAFAPLALVCAACLPSGPAEYDGPEYEIARSADAGGLSVADSGIVAADSAVAPPPTTTPTPTPTPGPIVDAGAPGVVDAGADAGSGGGLGVAGCTFDATTNSPGGSYANAYVLAIWVEDGAGKVVRTLAYYAQRRGSHLNAYNTARSGAAVDATSGATINASRSKAAGADTKVHGLSWDLKSAAGAAVQAGSYKIKVELTSSNGAGPVSTVPFTLGSGPVDVTPTSLGAGVSAVHLRCQ